MSRTSIILVSGFTLLVVLMVIGIISQFEPHEVTVEVGASGEALQNPYLAASRLLEKQGIKVKALSGLNSRDGLPPEDGVLILPPRRNTFSDQRYRDLLLWAERGGHLVATVKLPEKDEKIGLFEDSEEDRVVEDKPNQIKDFLLDRFTLDVNRDGKQHLATSSFNGDGDNLTVSVRTAYRLHDAFGNAQGFFQDEFGDILLSLPQGEGWVTFLVDHEMISNTHIGEAQNASLFYELITRRSITSEVWVVYRESYPSFWGLLIDQGRYLLIALVLLIGFWIWQKVPRLGPILPDPPLARRRLMEHIHATGEFFWQHHHGEHMIAATREAMMNKIRSRYPHWLTLSPIALQESLHERTGLEPSSIQEALEPGAIRQPEQFVRIVQTIETIRRTL